MNVPLGALPQRRGPSAEGTTSAEDSGEILIEREGHGVDGQITNSSALSNAPGFRAEGRWPKYRAPVVFFDG